MKSLGDCPPVVRLKSMRLEDEKVECSLRQLQSV